MPNVSKNLYPVLFADDTALLMSNSSTESLNQSLNNELILIDEWLAGNRLSLNIDTSCFLYFATSRGIPDPPVHVQLRSMDVRQEAWFRYLGVNVDSTLNFKLHISLIVGKISKSVGILHRIRHNAPSHVLLKLYYTLVYPYLTYCCAVWGCTYDVHLNPIRKLQKRIIRIVTNNEYLAHTDPLFKQVKVLKFDDIRKLLLAKIGYRWSISNDFRHASHGYETRNRNRVLPQYQRLSVTQHSLSFVVPTLWNDIPLHIRESNNMFEFIRSYEDIYCRFIID